MKKSLPVILVLVSLTTVGQNAIDSLKDLLTKNKITGTSQIDLVNLLATQVSYSSPDQVMHYAKEAIELSRKNGYLIGEIDANNTIGLVNWVSSSSDRAITCGLWALKKSDSIHYRKGMMEAYLLLGSIYKDLPDIDKAEAFTNHGLALALELADNVGIARAYNSLGNCSRLRKKDEEALNFYKTGLSYLKTENHFKILLTNNLVLYYLNKDIEREKTKMYLEQALETSINTKDKTGELQTRIRLGKFFKNSKEYNQATQQFTVAEKLGFELGIPGSLLELYPEMIDAEISSGQSKAAYQLVAKYVKLKDSLFSHERAKQVAEIETRLETEKKEQIIKLIEQEKQIHNIRQNLLLIGVVTAMFAAYIIYRLQRSRTRKAKQLLEVQQLLNEKLKDIDKLKSNFFAKISHEFRTPLTLILSPLEEALKRRSSPKMENDQLLLMRRNANRLLDLVNQLLDLSKLDAGRMELRVRLANPENFLGVITSTFDSWAEYKQVQFTKEIQKSDHPIWIDQDKVEKIIINLLANAFKFTPIQGTVTFSSNIVIKDSIEFLKLTIADTGVGIPDEDQEQVFSPFYQSNQSVEGQIGSGIGLTLVKELIALHHGTIKLKSTVGIGTTFLVELPANKETFASDQIIEGNLIDQKSLIIENGYLESEEVLEELDQESLIGLKDSIIIVEDNSDLRNFIATILKDQYVVHTASDGEEAFQLALRLIPNLILSDLMMPKMDGIQLTSKIKTDERTSHIPVILLTAKNEQQARMQSLKTGADDYVTKPFSNEELLTRINNLVEQRKLLVEKFRERILVPITSTVEASLDDKFLQKVRKIVEDNLAEFSFTVEMLSNEMNLSRTQLLRKLKALTGLSPNDFIKELRLKKAADMISKRIDTITQIGYAVGFNDQSYFTKCFKKRFGITPSDYSIKTSQKAVIQ